MQVDSKSCILYRMQEKRTCSIQEAMRIGEIIRFGVLGKTSAFLLKNQMILQSKNPGLVRIPNLGIFVNKGDGRQENNQFEFPHLARI